LQTLASLEKQKKKREKRKKNKEILISSNDAARAFSSDLLPFKNKTALLSWLLLRVAIFARGHVVFRLSFIVAVA